MSYLKNWPTSSLKAVLQHAELKVRLATPYFKAEAAAELKTVKDEINRRNHSAVTA